MINKHKKKFSIRKVLTITIIIVVLSVFIFGENGYLEYLQFKEKTVGINKKITDLKKKNKCLTKKIKRLETDTDTLEKEFRDMGMIKQGEKKVVSSSDSIKAKR